MPYIQLWDPMGIELVPVWNDLFLTLIESEPPVQKPMPYIPVLLHTV